MVTSRKTVGIRIRTAYLLWLREPIWKGDEATVAGYVKGGRDHDNHDEHQSQGAGHRAGTPAVRKVQSS